MGGVGVGGGTEQVISWWPRSREEYTCVSELSPLSPLFSSGPQPVGCFYSTQGGSSSLHSSFLETPLKTLRWPYTTPLGTSQVDSEAVPSHWQPELCAPRELLLKYKLDVEPMACH